MEVEVKFEPSGRNGIVPAGSYVFDAAARLGISIEKDCGRLGECDSCAVKIINGAEFLSEPTKAELEHLSPERRKKGERLACQAKIDKVGEITIMTTEKPKPEISNFEAFKKEFSELSLDEKVGKLLDLEAITLSETFSFILNLPYTIGEKVRDGLAQIGFQKEAAEKQAKRPAEHQTNDEKAVDGEEKKTEVKKKTPAKSATTKKAPATPKKSPTVKSETAPKKAATRKTTAKTAETPKTEENPNT
jgi:ferredoxin